MIARSSRPLSLLLAVALATASSTAFGQAGGPDAPSEIAAGDAATRAKDYAGALTHYQAAQQMLPSARAEMGVADALYQLGRLGEAYDTYADVDKTYPKLGAVEKGLVTKRLKELTPKTGWLSIRVSEAGAQVDVDGKTLGTSPVPALVRFGVGTHAIHVTKTGFGPFDAKAEVTGDGKAVVDATMAALATQGHVVVHSAGAEPLRVIVDGVDMGATPWEGDLPPGNHQISGRSSSATAEPQTVQVSVGSRTAIDLLPSGIAAHVQLRTSDGKGVIYVDGVVKGEGTFTGDLAPGPHSFVVSRDGYQRYEKPVTLSEKQNYAETVTLTQVPTVTAGEGEAAHAYQGLYGGFGLTGLFGIGGMGTELETNCSTLGAQSCDTPNTAGGGAFGYLGYTWDPVGFELMLGGMIDQAKQSATFAASQSSSGAASVLPAATPARTESFTFLRFGAISAIRARVAFQSQLLRATFAGGPGLSFRQMLMERDASANDSSGRVDKYVPDGVGYLSPGLSLEAALQIRLSPTVAISVGATFWADNASIAGNNAAPPSTGHALVNPNNSSTAAPIPTPKYDLATGPQVYIGPFLGMHFGP